MIFADKITALRKRNGWSQEDLAARMNVSRQAVAKWESAQAVPSLDKILLLSQIFEVSTDYLLKDEMEEAVYAEAHEESGRSVSLQEAHDYLENRRKGAVRLAIGVTLCILSPVTLIGLGAAAEFKSFGISEATAAGIGLIALLALVAAAVALFIWDDQENKPWKFLNDGTFSLDYGVKGMVREEQKKFARTKLVLTIVGIGLCVLSPVPIFCDLFFGETFLSAIMVDALLVMVAAGVFFLVLESTESEAMDRLLQEGDYTPENRRREKFMSPIYGCYWLVITAIYLWWSFSTNDWENTWIIWPVAGVLFAALAGIVSLLADRRSAN